MPGVVVGDNARIEKAVIARGAKVEADAVVADADGKVYLVGENCVVAARPRG